MGGDKIGVIIEIFRWIGIIVLGLFSFGVLLAIGMFIFLIICVIWGSDEEIIQVSVCTLDNGLMCDAPAGTPCSCCERYKYFEEQGKFS